MKTLRDFKDIHTHNPVPSADSVISLDYDSDIPDKGYYSIGIHPWQTESVTSLDDVIDILKTKAIKNNVVAIGEAGLDRLRGADIDSQKEIFTAQAILAETLGKPLVIHCVKAFDVLIAIKKILKPGQLWVVHGFRGKPQTARQLLDAGIALSFGEKFNDDALRVVDDEHLYTETDESQDDIDSIRGKIAVIRAKNK